jgi:hypothetical protein
MNIARYRSEMSITRRWAAAGLVAVAALGVAGCGDGSSVTGGGAASASSAATAAPSSNAPSGAIVVTRTGGIAGVVDLVRIAADGTASITSRTGGAHACQPAAQAIDRLRAIDLAALQATPTRSSRLADGFNYSVKAASGSASATEGDDNSRRAELVDAAAAVVASCLAGR